MKYCTLCKTKYEDSVTFCSVDGEVLEADPASIVDTVLDGQYQMEALLGKGGMGAVYRARHILLGDRVAIKVLPPEVRSNAEWLRRFRREGQAARRFRHPNAVTVYDLRTSADGTIYMVMEYVEGHTLDAELKKRGRFTAAEALEILSPIMSVLDTAHEMGVVHRDLKPENIMVGNPGNGALNIKLLDLGIAKMREIAGGDNSGNTALTMAGQVLGTPYYMSPEQWGEIPRDENLEIDGRADIYSLGLVFYEMISGRRCFSGNTLHELRREHVATKPPPLNQVVSDVPHGFSDAIEKATAKDRSDRQGTAGQLASELREGLNTASSGTAPNLAQFETVAIADRLQTNSDVNAPTIITIEASATAANPAATAAPPRNAEVRQVAQPTPDPVMSGATVAEPAPAESSITIAQPPRPLVSPAPAPTPRPVVVRASAKSGSKVGLIIGAFVVIFVLIGAGVGGFLIWNKSRTSGPNTNGNTNTNSGPVVPLEKELSRYWLELESGNEPSTRVAGLVPLASGQALKMHFAFTESGYLYLVGPGEGNKPTAFLTNKPFPKSGVTTNKVTANADYSFPSGVGNNLTLDASAGTDNFTVIYSATPLLTPLFLNAPVTGEPLSTSEQRELADFLNKYREKPAVSELDQSNPQAPFVRVKMVPPQSGDPIVFDIRIQHN
jgi:eukaryotic-like serine/threonine-protein kinase